MNLNITTDGQMPPWPKAKVELASYTMIPGAFETKTEQILAWRDRRLIQRRTLRRFWLSYTAVLIVCGCATALAWSHT